MYYTVYYIYIMIQRKEVRIADLKKGDLLTASQCEVVVAPNVGVTTPPGKVDLVVKYPNGKHVVVQWGKHTKVKIQA